MNQIQKDTHSLNDTIKQLVLAVGGSSGAIMMVDGQAKLLRCVSSYNMPEVWVKITNPLENTPNKNMNGRIALTGVAEIANNINKTLEGYPISSIIIVPVKKSNKVIANLEIISDKPNKTFNTADQTKLEIAAKELAESNKLESK